MAYLLSRLLFYIHGVCFFTVVLLMGTVPSLVYASDKVCLCNNNNLCADTSIGTSTDTSTASYQNGKNPRRLALSAAKHRIEGIKAKIKIAGGKKIDIGYLEAKAAEYLLELNATHPQHEKVRLLTVEFCSVVEAAAGLQVNITADDLKYRENEERIRKQLGRIADQQWRALLASQEGQFIEGDDNGYTYPNYEITPIDDLLGKWVVIDNVQWPRHQFVDTGHEFLFAGTIQEGLYFIDLEHADYIRAREAMKRYDREIARINPDQSWTILARFTSIDLLNLDSSTTGMDGTHRGYQMQVEAIHIPAQVTVLRADAGDDYTYAGIEAGKTARAALFTHSSIPAGADIFQLIDIFSTAMKEKNWDIYMEALHADAKEADYWAKRAWDIQQRKFAKEYVKIVAYKNSVEVLEVNATQETARVFVGRFNESGVQLGAKKPVYLKRNHGGRWYVTSGFPF